MSNYNLNDNVNDSFNFEVGGIVYNMTYPTVEELEQLQKIMSDIEAARAKGKTANDNGIMEWMYKFIKPEKDGEPAIAETMKKQNIKVFSRFTQMFKDEFGVE